MSNVQYSDLARRCNIADSYVTYGGPEPLPETFSLADLLFEAYPNTSLPHQPGRDVLEIVSTHVDGTHRNVWRITAVISSQGESVSIEAVERIAQTLQNGVWT